MQFPGCCATLQSIPVQILSVKNLLIYPHTDCSARPATIKLPGPLHAAHEPSSTSRAALLAGTPRYEPRGTMSVVNISFQMLRRIISSEMQRTFCLPMARNCLMTVSAVICPELPAPPLPLTIAPTSRNQIDVGSIHCLVAVSCQGMSSIAELHTPEVRTTAIRFRPPKPKAVGLTDAYFLRSTDVTCRPSSTRMSRRKAANCSQQMFA